MVRLVWDTRPLAVLPFGSAPLAVLPFGSAPLAVVRFGDRPLAAIRVPVFPATPEEAIQAGYGDFLQAGDGQTLQW